MDCWMDEKNKGKRPNGWKPSKNEKEIQLRNQQLFLILCGQCASQTRGTVAYR
jgi:hypothetical protein